jgi:hypothetical protein
LGLTGLLPTATGVFGYTSTGQWHSIAPKGVWVLPWGPFINYVRERGEGGVCLSQKYWSKNRKANVCTKTPSKKQPKCERTGGGRGGRKFPKFVERN